MSNYEEKCLATDKVTLSETVATLKAQLSDISKEANELTGNPISVWIKRKEDQLKAICEKYGKIDTAELDMDRIPLVLARVQGEEAIVRSDIARLKLLNGGQKDLKKRLDIARRILAEKNKPGGREI